jgi:hypothetical protein
MSETGAMEFVHRRRSRAEAEELVREFEASGLRRRVFCAERGLSVAALDEYRRQYGHGTTGNEGGQAAVEVIPGVSASKLSSALCVELANGRRIEVCSGFDAATLNRLLSVLEQA